MSCGPQMADEKISCGVGARRAGTWMVLAGGSPQPGQAHTDELALGVVGPC